MIEAAGEERALNWLEAVGSAPGAPSKDFDAGSSSGKKPLIISVVHSCLHSRATLARIEVLDAFVHVFLLLDI